MATTSPMSSMALSTRSASGWTSSNSPRSGPQLVDLLAQELLELHRLEAGADLGEATLVDARTGNVLSPLAREQIVARAKDIYQGEAEIREVTWITQAPQEVAKRPVPMWAVRFDDRSNTTLYFSPDTGDLLARRHDLWRWFDFLWMFHIMDYDTRDDVNNNLLRVAAGTGLVFALSGAWLVFYSFRRRAQP